MAEPLHTDNPRPSETGATKVPACGSRQGHSGHCHHPSATDTTGTRLLVTLALNLLLPLAQIVGGLMANSMALISDAVHNFSDFSALLISYIAFRIGRRGATVSNTFGYRRAEIVAALFNVFLLAGASAVIFYHAVQRLFHPQPVAGLTVILLAALGVAGNGISAWLLHHDAARSLNVRGAFLHMLGDLLTSVAVLINGLILLFYPWYWLDPLMSVLIVAFILKNGWGLLRQAMTVLMNATPEHIDLEQVRDCLSRLPGVLGVHYLHAWQVSAESTAFSCHVVVPDQAVSRTAPLAERIRRELWHRFGIDHPVLQFETEACGNATLLCEIACAAGTGPAAAPGGQASANIRPTRTCPRLLPWALRMLLGAVFLYASYDKILHPGDFARAVLNYQILPAAAVNLTAVVLPWVELLLGLCLVFGRWLPGATVLSTALLVIFNAALVFNLARGLDASCGCFSTQAAGSPADWWTVARDLTLLSASVCLTVFVFAHHPDKR